MSDSVSVGAGSSVNGDSSGRGSVSSYGTTSEWGDFENDVVVEQRTNELTRKQTVDGNTLSQPVCSSLLLQAPKGPLPCEAGSNDGSMSAALPPLIAAPPQPVAITLEVFREGMLSSDSPSAIDATSLRRRMRVHGTLASRAYFATVATIPGPLSQAPAARPVRAREVQPRTFSPCQAEGSNCTPLRLPLLPLRSPCLVSLAPALVTLG